ncbi:pilin N-terminal domain-containing protein [Enterococcus sp. HY326]|uniref:pilin N-terminal domain-containing protein n=1 Tax=Enterococcus sp. HY326 TaxID=2971265 RepID=UPI00223EC687|nr:pilin N-terminal domain-containing protein [Enterococcus sp. HY326]
MKKILRFLSVLLLSLTILGAKEAIAQATTNYDQVELILHKYIARDIVSDEISDYQNDGLPIGEEDWESVDVVTKATPLNGANFLIYNLTDYYYQDADSGADFVEKISGLNQNQVQALIETENLQQVIGSPVTTVTDDEYGRGTGRIFLSKKSGDLDCVYLVVETKVDASVGFNVDIDARAIPIAVILPIMDPRDPLTELQEIHIYPKNVGYIRDPYFFKLGRTAGSDVLTPLEGVTFALYQLVDGNKLYLQQSQVSDLHNQWLASSDPLTDSEVTKFISDEDGVVSTNERYLPSGTYYFEELTTAAGYEITAADKEIEVVIPESWQDEEGNPLYVTVNGYSMDELASGKVPDSAYQKLEPRVYNEKTVIPPTEDGGKLPDTGAVKSLMSIFGIMLLGVACFLKKRPTGIRDSKIK